MLTRRNVVIVLMSIELMLERRQPESGCVLALLAEHSTGRPRCTARYSAIFVITDAAGWKPLSDFGILTSPSSGNKETVNVDEVNLLKW